MPNGRLAEISQRYKDKISKIDLDAESAYVYDRIEEYLVETGKKVDGSELTFCISIDQIKILLQSYYLDVFRYADFHPYDESGKFLNKYKRASIFCKWLLKIQPISLVEIDGESAVEFGLQVNAYVAFAYSLALAEVDIDLISDNTKSRVIYSLFYRDFNESLYTFLLESWADRRKKNVILQWLSEL